MDLNRTIQLSDLKPGQPARVASIRTEAVEDLRRLMQAGVLPNASVNVIHRDRRHILFFTNYKEVAVDQDIASRIYVELGDQTAQKPGKSV